MLVLADVWTCFFSPGEHNAVAHMSFISLESVVIFFIKLFEVFTTASELPFAPAVLAWQFLFPGWQILGPPYSASLPSLPGLVRFRHEA